MLPHIIRFDLTRNTITFIDNNKSIINIQNSPNDLQMMSDAPAHHLFCLLGPVDPNRKSLPEVLVFIQVCLEGQISKNTVMSGMSRGVRASGDLIPWTISQQYQDPDFPRLSGARIVRIATHPDYQGVSNKKYS